MGTPGAGDSGYLSPYGHRGIMCVGTPGDGGSGYLSPYGRRGIVYSLYGDLRAEQHVYAKHREVLYGAVYRNLRTDRYLSGAAGS